MQRCERLEGLCNKWVAAMERVGRVMLTRRAPGDDSGSVPGKTRSFFLIWEFGLEGCPTVF